MPYCKYSLLTPLNSTNILPTFLPTQPTPPSQGPPHFDSCSRSAVVGLGHDGGTAVSVFSGGGGVRPLLTASARRRNWRRSHTTQVGASFGYQSPFGGGGFGGGGGAGIGGGPFGRVNSPHYRGLQSSQTSLHGVPRYVSVSFNEECGVRKSRVLLVSSLLSLMVALLSTSCSSRFWIVRRLRDHPPCSQFQQLFLQHIDIIRFLIRIRFLPSTTLYDTRFWFDQ